MRKIDVFTYTDAKLYLLRCRGSRMPPWPLSYGFLADHLGTNKGLIWGALHGTKSFSRKMADRLPPLLKMKKNEALYLRVMLYLSSMNMGAALKVSILNKFRPAQYRKFTK
ncbi:MAG: hypothetical protein ABSF80_11510 [Chitinispirillaceae bacterium]|jgi:hypothetical protein